MFVKTLQSILENPVAIGFISAMIGGLLCYVGSIHATNKNIDYSKMTSADNEKINVYRAARNLIVNIDIICSMGKALSNGIKSLPKEVQGVPIVDHRIAPINWFNDLSVVSTKLEDDEYNELIKFFIEVTKCNDLLERSWELRAAGQSPNILLVHFWNLLPGAVEDHEKLNKILKKLTN
jgi:hypothetical protein